MPFQIVRNDITKVKADAIVNTANPMPIYAGAVDRSIYLAAGKEELLEARKKIGQIEVGKAAYTPAFALQAKYIIHTVGPAWVDGQHDEVELVRSCYRESLKLADELKCQSIAFPLISSGAYGFPKGKAIEAATAEIYSFLLVNPMMVYLVVYDQNSYDLSGNLFPDISAYIDEQYIEEQEEAAVRAAEVGDPSVGGVSFSAALNRGRISALDAIRLRRQREARFGHSTYSKDEKDLTLEEFLSSSQPDFPEYLMGVIKKKGLKTSEVYGGANMSKQTFSNIRHGVYPPQKNAVAALAISLQLSVEEAEEFYEHAGYSLTKSQKMDLVIRYFLAKHEYNIVMDNVTLDAYGLPTLGVKVKKE